MDGLGGSLSGPRRGSREPLRRGGTLSKAPWAKKGCKWGKSYRQKKRNREARTTDAQEGSRMTPLEKKPQRCCLSSREQEGPLAIPQGPDPTEAQASSGQQGTPQAHASHWPPTSSPGNFLGSCGTHGPPCDPGGCPGMLSIQRAETRR